MSALDLAMNDLTTFSVSKVAKMFGDSTKRLAQRVCEKGSVPARRVGSRDLPPGDAIQGWIEHQEDGSDEEED